ncbi:MAG: zf-HC2 domain-containing protein [Anaerolineales bacterium]|nr:zf-HC2 domain-containing protein [Anaerolineales bacterium]
MNGHLGQLLEAYLDGELGNGERRRAEEHVKACPECRAELERRRALSMLLKSAPAPAGGKSEQRFVSEIALRLQRKAAARLAGRPHAMWITAPPVALFLAWAFVQSAAIVAEILQWIPDLNDALQAALSAAGQGRIPETGGEFALSAIPTPGIWDAAALMMLMIGIGVLFTGWFAGWCAGQQTAGSPRCRRERMQ